MRLGMIIIIIVAPHSGQSLLTAHTLPRAIILKFRRCSGHTRGLARTAGTEGAWGVPAGWAAGFFKTPMITVPR